MVLFFLFLVQADAVVVLRVRQVRLAELQAIVLGRIISFEEIKVAGGNDRLKRQPLGLLLVMRRVVILGFVEPSSELIVHEGVELLGGEYVVARKRQSFFDLGQHIWLLLLLR